MNLRRDVFPPVLALVLSLGLHSSLLGIHPWQWLKRPAEQVDTVLVQLLEDGESGRPPTPPVQSAVAEKTPPPTPVAVREQPLVPVPDPPLQNAEDSLDPPPLPPSDPAPEEEQAPPDPTAAGVREASLSLGTTDLRYRDYLDAVHDAIDRSERWKDAVLAGGGGAVVVRMTLTELGQAEAVEILRSSGSALLDSAAESAVREAQIPPFPAHWEIERLHLDASFDYRLVTY